MAAPDDTYTHGHHESVLRSHRWRTVENSAGYLIPHLSPGLDVLDVGCGPGTITVDLARRVSPGSVVGIDRSAPMLDRARRRVKREAPILVVLGNPPYNGTSPVLKDASTYARLRALLPPALLLFYVVVADRLGFIITAALIVFVTSTALGTMSNDVTSGATSSISANAGSWLTTPMAMTIARYRSGSGFCPRIHSRSMARAKAPTATGSTASPSRSSSPHG